jgi:hypothetical protein
MFRAGFSIVVAPGATQMWKPLSITTNLGWDIYLFLLILLIVTKIQAKFSWFQRNKCLNEFCGFCLCLVRALGRPPSPTPLHPALPLIFPMNEQRFINSEVLSGSVEFGWPLHLSIIYLLSCGRTESWAPHASREPMCVRQYYIWAPTEIFVRHILNRYSS